MTVTSTRPYTPYLACAKVLSTWFRIKVLMAVILICILLLLVLSGITASYYVGSYSTADSSFTADNWQKMCDGSPIVYLRPFAFTFTSTGGTSTTFSQCPWPATNSGLRLSTVCVSLLVVVALYISTPVSRAARTIFLFFTFLYFASFILDCNQIVNGYGTCSNNFSDTPLSGSISKNGVSVTCLTTYTGAVAFFDLLLTLLMYLTSECWAMCPNLYNRDPNAAGSTVMGKSTKNPMVEEKTIVYDGINYSPNETPHNSGYAPAETSDVEVPSGPPPPVPRKAGGGSGGGSGGSGGNTCFLF